MRTSVQGLTYESQITHFPSHFSHNRPMATPACFLQKMRSG
uniref:Uncharacterized protein n=1 Tax=Anguilla anguilla TaxID=7936 RepID=A0A0E9XB55_ANGAN